MQRLHGITQNYQWGSHTLLASLRGETSSELPEAEIWYGAHPQAPATFDDGQTLLAYIENDPANALGETTVKRFGPKLPFLLKLLAADRPLSIQAHPTVTQAEEGFAREEDAGVQRDAPNRSFRDRTHKPELIAAITPFEALVGFRPIADSLELLHALGAPGWLGSLLAKDGPTAVLELVLAPETDDERRSVVTAVQAVVSGAQAYDGDRWATVADLLARLDSQYPGDAGIVVASLLRHVVLEPDQAVFLDAGSLHAYVGGLGVEAMANSDNVIRGGLTPKHIDVDALIEIVEPAASGGSLADIDDNQYVSPAPEFALTRIDPTTDRTFDGPAIVIGVRGETTCSSERDQALTISPTESVWIPYGETVTVSTSGLSFATEVASN